ncbi:MAG: sulfate adenylyltransferase, partial [Nitrospirae bacterium]|nr:sulfate adenylyltransferase [Candidatus Troglogloeales bacterium]
MSLSTPHGGKLINRFVDLPETASEIKRAKDLATLSLSPREISDLDLIAEGVLSPLLGFMGWADYQS